MMLKIKIKKYEKKDAEKKVNALIDAITDFSKVMPDFGKIIREQFSFNFISQGRPTAWKPSESAQIENRLTGVDTGTLLASLNPRMKQKEIRPGFGASTQYEVFEFGKLTLRVGTSLSYGWDFAKGTNLSGVPRPYDFISQRAIDRIGTGISKHVKDAVKNA